MNSKEINLIEYKTNWNNLFLELKEKLQSIGKEIFVDIEHIGSTSIEGMKAKDIVDVQCSIKSFNDMQLLQPKLALIGFEMVKTIKQGHVPFHDMVYFSPQWEKRFFKGIYQNQAYNVHIRLVDSLNWQFSLKFKDFLSKNDKARYAFMQVKERLVDAGVDQYAYCILKDSIIDLMSLQFDFEI